MRRKTRDFGRFKFVAAAVFAVILLPKFLFTGAADELGSFAEGETGIKLCAIIDGGNEDAMRFYVSSDRGFAADVVVLNNSCRSVQADAASYTVKQLVPQEYELESVSGGTVSADNTAFIATSEGQYSIVYTNTYKQKPYIHSFGYTGSSMSATAVEVSFDANGGAGTMVPQRYGLNAQQSLTSNSFARAHFDFIGWNTAADGSGDSYSDGQDVTFATGGELKLYAQWREHPVAYNVVASKVNNLGDYEINFAHAATVSDDVETANGNGVNTYMENGKTVYYYRGQIADNNVIWAGKCWKIVRTTATGGTKMIYNGVPNSLNQCVATGAAAQITYNGQNTFVFNEHDSTSFSPADVGYMYGTRYRMLAQTFDSANFWPTYAGRGIEYNAETGLYTLTDAEYFSELNEENSSAVIDGYRYFCEYGTESCETAFYLVAAARTEAGSEVDTIILTDGANLETAKSEMFANENNSIAKATIEAWFENENLDEHEDDLEDAVFCNDRSITGGPLKSVNDRTYFTYGAVTVLYNIFGSYSRAVDLSDNTLRADMELSLDCAKKDSFTKNDATNGNAKLAHKTGLITADEAIMSGMTMTGSSDNYLYSGKAYWTASPTAYLIGDDRMAYINDGILAEASSYAAGLRPMVSLKSGTHFTIVGDGTATNPYIVE